MALGWTDVSDNRDAVALGPAQTRFGWDRLIPVATAQPAGTPTNATSPSDAEKSPSSGTSSVIQTSQ